MKAAARDILLALVAFAAGFASLAAYGWLTTRPALAKIEGPTTAGVGQMILLDASGSHGDMWSWSYPPGAGVLDIGDGRSVFKADALGQYDVSLVVQSASGGKLSRSEAHHTIGVGVAPIPPTPPGPNPPPVPPTPPGSLSEAAKSLALQCVTSSGRAAQAKIVAGAYRDVASRIASGTIKSPTEIESQTLDDIQRGLGDDYAAWLKWINELKKVSSQRLKIDSPLSDIQAAWDEIAAGLEGVN